MLRSLSGVRMRLTSIATSLTDSSERSTCHRNVPRRRAAAAAVFDARCSVLEELAYGRETGRPEYVDKSLAALGWLVEQ
jgi:hypothetical protein